MHRRRHYHHSHQHAHPWGHDATVIGDEGITFSLDVPSRTLDKRSKSTSTCLPDDTSPQCEKPAAATNSSLPIVLGAAIPIVVALLVLVWLHRRHMQKLKLEEINDKTKSMDFGMGFGAGTRKGNGEKGRNNRQLSMDLDLGNPYIVGAPGSRNSLSSLTKGFDAGDPRYGPRPGTSHSQSPPQNGIALQPQQRNYAPSHHSNLAQSRTRESSIYTASIRGDDSPNGSTMSMSAELLGGAQAMPMSSPPPPRSASLRGQKSPNPELRVASPPIPNRPMSPSFRPNMPAALQPGVASEPRDSYIDKDGGDLRRSHQHLASHIAAEPDAKPGPAKAAAEFRMTVSGPPQIDQAAPSTTTEPMPTLERPTSDSSNYGDDAQNPIQFRFSTASDNDEVKPAPRNASRDTLAPGRYDNRRLSMGLRPLPPDGNPDESAEERALRIRSFYKEYFDESNMDQPIAPVGNAHAGYGYHGDNDHRVSHRGSFYGTIDDGFMPIHQDDATPVYDPSSDRYMIPGARPFAELPVRRAMTPPPRMPQQDYGPRSQSSVSNRFPPPGPRSYTSSGGRSESRGAPRRPMPPPAPLKILPTPHQLSEDAFGASIAFAPKPRMQDILTGRDSPSLLAGERPYSPSISPHIPLASSFDELMVLPTPSALRKSGTYTALDFAPPRKFKNDDSSSDAGSIRSNRTNLNPQTLHNIRAGAYRISRIPQEVVPCKDDIAAQLKPNMDLSQRY